MDYHTYTYDCSEASPSSATQLDTRGRLSLGRAGEKPKDVRTVQAPNTKAGAAASGGPAGEGGEQPKEPQTFMQRYWLYIVLGVVYLFLSPGGAPEGQAGAAGGAAAAGPRAGKR